MLQNIIIVTKEGEETQYYSGIKKACNINPEFNHSTLKDRRPPFDYKGYHFEKKPIN